MLGRCAVFGVLLTLTGARDMCTYECDTCGRGQYYDTDQSQSELPSKGCYRNDQEVRHILLGKLDCSQHFMHWEFFRKIASLGQDAKASETIHDRSTCDIRNFVEDHGNITDMSELIPSLAFMDIYTTWDDNATAGGGCKIWSRPCPLTLPDWAQFKPLSTVVCLQRFRWRHTIFLLSTAVLFGLILALVADQGKCCKRLGKTAETDREKRFRIGSKLIAARAVVEEKNSRMLYMCLAFRCFQVISNTGTPMVLLILVSHLVVLPFYVLLYVLPAMWFEGTEVLKSPYLLVTPPDVSLFGIDHVQKYFPYRYLYHGFRCYIMISCCVLVAYLVHRTYPEAEGAYSVNYIGFFRVGLMSSYNEFVFHITFLITFLANIAFCMMTCALVAKQLSDNRCCYYIPVSFHKRRKLGEETYWLASKIQEEANKIASQLEAEEIDAFTGNVDGLAGKLMRNESHISADRLFGALQQDYPDLDRYRLTYFDIFKECMTSLTALAGYCYRLYIFSYSGQKDLAFVIMLILSWSMWKLLLAGTLCRAREAVETSSLLGVRTFDFVVLTRWNDSGVGIVSLMLVIYGVPLSDVSSWPAAFFALAFTAKNVVDLAWNLVRMIDYDTHDAFKTAGERHGCHALFAAVLNRVVVREGYEQMPRVEIGDLADIGGKRFLPGDLVTCTASGDFQGEQMVVKEVTPFSVHFKKAASSNFSWDRELIQYRAEHIKTFGIQIDSVHIGDRVECLIDDPMRNLHRGTMGIVDGLEDQVGLFGIRFGDGTALRVNRSHFRILSNARAANSELDEHDLDDEEESRNDEVSLQDTPRSLES